MSKSIMRNVSIFCLIPAFDEMGNLAELTLRLTSVFYKGKIKFKILYVLQGSKENLKTVQAIRRKYPQVGFLYYPKALGIGKAYQMGFKQVKKNYSHVFTLDADLNHQPEELPKFLAILKKSQPDIIVGSRFVAGGQFHDKRAWKKISSFLANLLVTKLAKINVHDVTSGFRLIKREVIEKIRGKLREKDYPSYMEFILLAKQSNFHIEEIPINYIPRRWGKSKMGKAKTFLNYLFFLPRIFSLLKNPD